MKQEASYQEQMFAILIWHCPPARFQKSGRGDEDGMQLFRRDSAQILKEHVEPTVELLMC